MATITEPMSVCIEGELLIPASAATLDGFREWLRDDEFPEGGRIDYLQGRIELDMAPEDLQAHAALKGELYASIREIIRPGNLGQVFVDGAQLTSLQANFSCKPDVLYVSWKTLKSGRARYVATSLAKPARWMEIQGAVDLVVEVISNSSVSKDTKRLPPLYAMAGVRELWLADARGQKLEFRILHLRDSEYAPAPVDSEGFQRSEVLGLALRLLREEGPMPETWLYRMETRP